MVQVEAKLSYQENCDYLPSEIIDYIDIDQQNVDITTTINIINYDNRQFTPKGNKTSEWINSEGPPNEEMFYPYFNDELLLEAYVTFTYDNVQYDIKFNDINIYFFTEYEDRTQINPDDAKHIIARNLKLDENGKVGTKYLPHTSGYFIIEFNETKYFKHKIVEHHIELQPIPTKVYIKPVYTTENEMPLFVHLKEAVNLAASVRDTYGNHPKDGAITFLSYGNTSYYDTNTEVANRKVRIIGNPILIEDGETLVYDPPTLNLNENSPIPAMGDITEGPTPESEEWTHYVYNNGVASGFISYSPRQDYALEKNESNFETINAWFNYDSAKFGQSWKYYQGGKGTTRISVLIPGQISISLRKNENTNWMMREDGLYEFKTTDTLLAYASLLDEDGNPILIHDNNKDKYHIKFKIKGTQWNASENERVYTNHVYDGIPSRYFGTDNDKVIFELKLDSEENAGLPINNEFNSYYDYHNNKQDIQHDKLKPGIYSIEAYVDVEAIGNPYYDSMVSDKAYFEVI